MSGRYGPRVGLFCLHHVRFFQINERLHGYYAERGGESCGQSSRQEGEEYVNAKYNNL